MKSFFKKLIGAACAFALAAGAGVALGIHQEAKSVRAADSNFTLSGASDVTVDGVTASFAKASGSSAPAWYAAGLRLYANNTVTISSANTITGVSFNWEKQGTKAFATATADSGSYVHPTDTGTGTWTGSATSVVFTLGSSGQLQLNTFTVTHNGGGGITYTITYDANGGTGTMEDSTGSAPTVAACTFTAPEGMRFARWNTEDDGTGTDYAVGTTATSDLDLYAIWETKPACVTLDKIGTSLGSTANTTMETVDIEDGSDTYTLNYFQCKKQGDSMFMTKDVNPFISNHTAMPASILSVELYINSGASGDATYDVAFGTSEFTTATAGIGAVNIGGGANHSFDSNVTGATYFCITLGASKNGQVLKIVVNYESGISTTIVDNHNYPISTYELTEGGTSLVFKYFDLDNNVISGATWTTSDDTIIHLNPKTDYSYISGLKVGVATVTASKEGYKPATCTFTVVADPSKSDLTPHKYNGSSAGDPADGTTIIWDDTVGLYEYVALDDDSNIVTTATWTSSDPSVATVTSSAGVAAITTLKPGSFTLTVTAEGYNSGTATIKVWESYLESIVVSGSMTKTAYKSSESWDPTGFTVTATFQSSWTADVTSDATWTYNPAAPADGVTSVVATATYTDGIYTETANSAAQAVTVTVSHAGTAEDPFTVAEAIQKCKDNGTTAAGPWVTKGIISKVNTWDSRYPNITFWISEDGTGTDDATKTVQAFRCKYVGNVDVTSTNSTDVVVGKVAVIYGNLVNYKNSTPEYDAGCYLLELKDNVDPSLDNMTIKNSSSEAGPFSMIVGESLSLYSYNESSVEVSSTWEISDNTIASISTVSGHASITALKGGTVTVTAKAEGYNDATATLTCSYNYTHAGTAADPFTVAEALNKATEIGAVGNVGQGPWVTKGIITRVTEAPAASYWNATYYISDDGSSTNELQVYRGFYLDNEKFDDTTKELLKAGKVVTVTGNLTGSFGSEYCSGNYLLSIEDQSTGDIDVTFEPTDSLEVGATGTLTASTTAQNPHYEFSVDNESIFDLDYTTGEYEVLDVGVVEVTVTVTSDDGNGQASAFITLNGNSGMMKNVTQANAIAATIESGKTTQYYYYFEGFVSQFNCDGQNRALMITTFDESDSIEVFVGKSGYSAFIEGLNLGDAIRFKANVQNYSGTYELTNPVLTYSEYVSTSFAYELISLTDAVCHDYDGVTDNSEALEAVWTTLSAKYATLSDLQKNALADPTTYGAGDTVKNAMARYDYLVVKYGLDNFISGRTPSGLVNQPTVINNNNNDSSAAIILVSIVALASVTSIAVLLVVKRRKTY